MPSTALAIVRLGSVGLWTGTTPPSPVRQAQISDRLRIAAAPNFADYDLPMLEAAAEAMAWFDQERVSINAVLRAAADREWSDPVWAITEALWLYCYNRKPFTEWIEAAELGLEAARRIDDPLAEARMGAILSRAYLDLADLDRADAALTAAEAAGVVANTPAITGSLLEFRGLLAMAQGDNGSAVNAFEQAHAIFIALGWTRGAALQDQFIGRCRLRRVAVRRQ